MPSKQSPAFLLYSSDFLTGCSDLTMEERGQYITLLCLQHQKGSLSEKAIGLALGNPSGDVLAKFVRDPNGKYYSKRLREVQEQQEKSGWRKRAASHFANCIKYTDLPETTISELKKSFNIRDFEEYKDSKLLGEKIKNWFQERVRKCAPKWDRFNEDENENTLSNNTDLEKGGVGGKNLLHRPGSMKPIEPITFEEVHNHLVSAYSQHETWLRNFDLHPQTLNYWIQEYLKVIENNRKYEQWTDRKECISHFANWIPIQLQKAAKNDDYDAKLAELGR